MAGLAFLTRDGLAQTAGAKSLVETQLVFLVTSVVLATAWVLRGTYRFERAGRQGVHKLRSGAAAQGPVSPEDHAVVAP